MATFHYSETAFSGTVLVGPTGIRPPSCVTPRQLTMNVITQIWAFFYPHLHIIGMIVYNAEFSSTNDNIY